MKALACLATALATAFAASPALSQTLRPWMSPEIGAAWNLGYKGQGTTITVVDDFKSGTAYWGNLTGTGETLMHGQWTFKQSGMVSPLATMLSQDFRSGTQVGLAGTGLNVLNLSYGMMASSIYARSTMTWSAQESSIISYARDGKAVISKSAGNDGVAVGTANAQGQIDYLGRDLIGAKSAIFVGALAANGTTAAPASMARYSNTAGGNATVQKQFLVVGVDSGKTGLAGTSFAAPIVSGYAAILGSKFETASPTQIANQLLTTARRDTIRNYKASVHGMGEASLTRALAPSTIN